jgi:uncharacterized protein YukE/type II secretory pathway pseudopilin PulG
MSLADDLDQAAQSLRQLAGKYTTTSSTFSQQAQGLQGLVEGLTSGASRWAGNSSLAFQLSWNRTSQDSKNVRSALTSAAGLMTSLASVLETHAPIIRSAQNIQQNAPFMPRTTQQEVDDVQKMVQQAVQQEQNALTVITMMVSQIADKLDEAAQEVGFCSTGQDEKNNNQPPFDDIARNDSSGNDTGTGQGGTQQNAQGLMALGIDEITARLLAELGITAGDIQALLGLGVDQITAETLAELGITAGDIQVLLGLGVDLRTAVSELEGMVSMGISPREASQLIAQGYTELMIMEIAEKLGWDYTDTALYFLNNYAQVGYGATDLSQAAIQFRLATHLTSARDVAVFEYIDQNGDAQLIVMASQRGAGHAERLIAQELARLGVHPSQVTRIYSELEPCLAAGGYCKILVAKDFSQAEVTFSFPYKPGSQQVGVDALKQVIQNLFKNKKP